MGKDYVTGNLAELDSSGGDGGGGGGGGSDGGGGGGGVASQLALVKFNIVSQSCG